MHNLKFTDAKFMSVEEKQKVLKHWEKFIKNKFGFKHFTKLLYKHLTLHCSFIAHYDRHGFYRTYFEKPEDTIRFFKQFDTEYGCISAEFGMVYWLNGDYSDLNRAMCEVWDHYKEAMYAELISANLVF